MSSLSLSLPLSPLERRFVAAVEALADLPRPGGAVFRLEAPRAQSPHPARAALLGAWACSASDDERARLVDEAEAHARACPAQPRNATVPVPSTEDELLRAHLLRAYGPHPVGERVPWTPEHDARELAASYVAQATVWLGVNLVDSAKQPGFLRRWSGVMDDIVSHPSNYERAPARLRSLRGERVLTGDAAMRLFDAAKRLQIHFDVLGEFLRARAEWVR